MIKKGINMQSIVRLYSVLPNEINKFLSHFYGTDNSNTIDSSSKQWQKEYPNPVETADIIRCLYREFR